jgi:hypothetical protein
MTWFTRSERPASPIGDALRRDVDTTTTTRAKADAGDPAARRRLDARDLGGRVAEALRAENPGRTR